MRLKFEPLGKYIHEVDVRNNDLSITKLMGVNLSKTMMPSVANIVGTDLSVYKVVKHRQFACKLMSVGRDACLPIALKTDEEPVIISSAYYSFEVNDENELLPEYLMMCFLRPDFDRELWFKTGGDVRGGVSWETFNSMKIPVTTIDEQRKVVHNYQVIKNRIKLLQKMNSTLEEIVQSLYSSWFISYTPFDHCVDEEGNPLPPEGWEYGELGDCIDFINGYAFKSGDLLDRPCDNGYAVFKMGNIKKGGGINHEGTKSWINENLCKGLEKFVLKKGDVLMSMTDMKENVALLGHTALMDIDDQYIVNQRVGLLRPNGYLGVSPYQIYSLTNNPSFIRELRRHAHAGVQVNLSKKDIVSSRVVYAPETINKRFAEIVEPYFDTISSNLSEIRVLNSIATQLLIRL